MKLTQKQLRELHRIKEYLETAESFIMQERIVLCSKSNGTTTIEYHNEKEGYITPLTKEIGSNLCGLFNAKRNLLRFIVDNT